MSRTEWIFAGVTALVALYGAVLSTYSLIVARRDKKRRVSVSLSLGLIGFAGRESPTVVLIEASNPGDRAVTLQPGMIVLPNGSQVVPKHSNSSVPFPHELPEGKSCTCWIETDELARLLHEQGYRGQVKLIGAFRNALGTQYRSKPIKFSVEQWRKAS